MAGRPIKNSQRLFLPLQQFLFPPLPVAFDFVPHLCFTNFQPRKIQIPNKSQNITQNLKKPLTNHFLCDRILKRKRAHQYLAELCSGSTADSDSVCLGSNPSSAAKRRKTPLRCLFSFDCGTTTFGRRDTAGRVYLRFSEVSRLCIPP